MEPCDVWKRLEKAYGLGDAGGLIELTGAWTRLTSSNWKDLGTHFAQLKKLRNEINRKSQCLFKRDMVTEEWLCIEVLAELPSEFWASSIAMTPEGFTIEQVEDGLRKVFGEKSRKEIGGHLDKGKSSVHVNAVRQPVQKKRKVLPGACFYCHEEGHIKVDCPLMKSDRDPSRPGGPIFRSDINTAPGSYKGKSKMVMKTAMKKKVNVQVVQKPATRILSPPPGLMDMEFPDGSDVDEDGSQLDDAEMEVRKAHPDYFLWLEKLQLTDAL
jgi:hypothetical protein